MTTTTLKIGTRASALARTQTQGVADALGADVALVPITTEGDRSTAELATIGGTGVFVSALRAALLDRTIDVAVHSCKDLPTAPADGIVIAAIPPREDPRDALVARDGLTLGELPPGARVGTGAPRRAAQLRALGLGLEIVPIRGNVDTRLRKVAEGGDHRRRDATGLRHRQGRATGAEAQRTGAHGSSGSGRSATVTASGTWGSSSNSSRSASA